MYKILVPISNRTNYSKLKPVLSLLRDINVGVIVSSSMLLEKYGNPETDLVNDGFNIVGKVDCLFMNDSTESMSKTTAISMIGHSQYYADLTPRAVLVTGDRFDMLAAAVSAHMMNIPVLHIQGGERSGSIDNSVRDIISICATEHYAATEKAAAKVRQVTDSDKVYFTGCPAVEIVSSINVGDRLRVENLHKKFKHQINIKPGEDYLLVVVHPVTTDHESVSMQAILQAVSKFDMKCILLYPNPDAFNTEILKEIRNYADKLILIKHAPLEDFVAFMAHASCMIGNSSAGIREAASFGTPVVNVGTRQMFRERNKNTIDVNSNESDIREAISQSLAVGKYPVENVYLKNGAAQNIACRVREFLGD